MSWRVQVMGKRLKISLSHLWAVLAMLRGI
jgi:hypothetical protein